MAYGTLRSKAVERLLPILLIAVTTGSANPSPLQMGLLGAISSSDSVAAELPVFGAALRGQPGEEIDRDLASRLLLLPPESRAPNALIQSVLGAREEAAARGVGQSRVREAVRLAGNNLGLHWYLTILHSRIGTPQTFGQHIDGLEAAALTSGWLRLPDAASWMLVASQELKLRGEDSMAARTLEAAIRLDPISPVPPGEAARRAIRQLNFGEAIHHAEESFSRLLYHASNQHLAAFNFLRLLRYTLALFFLLILVAWMTRHWPMIVHHIAELLPHETHLFLRYGVLAVGTASLLVAGLGILAASFGATILLWTHLRRHEKFLAGIILVFAGLQPWLAGFEATLASRFDRAGTEAVAWRVVHEGWSEDLERSAADLDTTGPRAGIAYLALSQVAKKGGTFTLSESLARRAHALNPSDPRTITALANALYLRSSWDSALDLYRSALHIDPTNPVLPFNIVQTLADLRRTHEATQLQRDALSAARNRLRQTANINSRHFQTLPPLRAVLNPEPSISWSWSLVMDDFAAHEWQIGRHELQTGLFDIPPSAVPWTAGILLLGLWFYGQRPVRRRSLFHCRTCGRTMCAICRKGMLCQPCHGRLAGIDEVEARNTVLERIDIESRRRRRFLRLGLDLALPGTGTLSARPNFLSFVQVFLFTFLVSFALDLPSLLSEYPATFTQWGSSGALILLGLLYVYSLFKFLRCIARDTDPEPSAIGAAS